MKKTKSDNNIKRRFRIIIAISTAVVIAIATFAVLLCYKIPWSYDMTIQQLFTLSQQSVTVLDKLDEDVSIAAVYPSGQEEPMVKSLLNEYIKASDKVHAEYIDVEQEPAKLAAYNLKVTAVTNGSIIVKSGSRLKIIDKSSIFEINEDGSLFNGEREITGAIRYVTSKEMPVVYFIQGDGETDTSASLNKAVAGLQQDAIEVKTLRLTEGNAIPDDAAVLIFISPKSDITDTELAKLEDYMRKGGSILLTLDSVMNSNDIVYNNISKLLYEFGLVAPNSYVVEEDASHYLSKYNLYLIPLFGEHEITKQIAQQDKMVILPIARALSTTEDYDKNEITNTVLMQSSNNSWIRADMTITDTNQTAKDYIGPAPLAYASVKSNVQWGNDPARLVIVGNSSFAYDGNIEIQANRDFFLNSALWLIGNREPEVISSKVINSGTLIIRGDEFTGLAILCVFILPILAFAAAFLVWFSRRNR